MLTRAARRVRARVLSIPAAELTFPRRGFRPNRPEVVEHLERVGFSFRAGFRAALLEATGLECAAHIDGAIDAAWRGFAYEGAAFGYAMLDAMSPWPSRRWEDFVAGPAGPHVYMAHVGFGMAVAELAWKRSKPLASLDRLRDPLLRNLAIDGFGFHHGFFFKRRFRDVGDIGNPLCDPEARVFDQGFGRSLWFVAGADVDWLADRIAAQPERRRADLWAGAGLAAAYAGGADYQSLERLTCRANGLVHHLAQGCAFAAQARRRAGNPAGHTELACEVIWGLPAARVAAVTDDALDGLATAAPSAYEVWRHRIRTCHLERWGKQ